MWVFQVNHKHGGRSKHRAAATLGSIRDHDSRLHGRMFAAVDLPLGGDGSPTYAARVNAKLTSRAVFVFRQNMDPEYAGSDSGTGSGGSKTGFRWNQLGIEEKQAAIAEEMKRMRQLPLNSRHAVHRLRLLDKIQQLLSLQRTMSQDEELELLFAGLHM